MPKAKDTKKTKDPLIKETASLRRKLADLEQSRSELKRAQESLQESQEELEAIFNNVMDGIALVNMTGKIIKVNKRITQVSGYTEKELVGKRFTILKMATAKSMAKMIAAFTKTIAGQRVPPYEVEGYMQTGEKRIGEMYGSLLRKKARRQELSSFLETSLNASARKSR
jgi:PAS domain S-box-containing protein